MSPPTVEMNPEARRRLAAVVAKHPRRRIRIRQEGYG